MYLPTVKVHHPNGDGYIIINESDYLPDTHKLWDDDNPGVPRAEAILTAVEQVVESGEGLTQAGVPKVEAVEAVLGYDITADERNTAWAAWQEAQAGE